MAHIKLETEYLIKSNWKKGMFSALIFCFYSGTLLKSSVIINLSVFEFVLLSFNNQFFLMFCFLPVYLMFLYSTFSNHIIHIIGRYNKFVKFYMYELISIGVVSFLYVMLHILCASLIGLIGHLSINNTYSLNSEQEIVLQLFKKSFNTPFEAIALSSLYTIIGVAFFAALVKCLFYYFGKKVVILGTMVIYFSSIFAIQKSVDENFPYLFFNNYFILPSALIKESALVLLSIMFIVLVIILTLTRKIWRYHEL